MSENLKAKVTAHGDYIIIEPQQTELEKDVFYPVGDGRIGNIIIDTGKHLGMSKEAVETIKRVKANSDAIGDLQTWKADGKGDCFGWIGGLYGLFNVTRAECDRDGIIDIAHVEIPNEVPEGALEAINNPEGKGE